MSAFPKVLWNITVPAGGWDFAFNDGVARTVTVPAATYYHILDLVDELISQLDASPSALDFKGTVSSIGTVAISANGAWTVNWAGTTAGLRLAMGYTAEAVDGSNVLTAGLQHLYGYYPGTISYGRTASRGAGLTHPFVFIPDWPMIRSIAGCREARAVGPAYPSEDATFALSIIKWTEYSDTSRGVRAWLDGCITSEFYVYPNRVYGTVAAFGTQNTDYYLCTFRDDMKTNVGQHPDYLTLNVPLHKEPVP